MGWKEDEVRDDGQIPHPGYPYGERFWRTPDGKTQENPPPISTDDATAFATLEQLCKPVEEGGKDWPYWISSPLRPGRVYGVRCNNHKTKSTTFAHAAALAIKAALEAEK